MNIQAFIDKMRTYAQGHIPPWEFLDFNEEDATGKIKTKPGRLLYLDNWTKTHSGTESYARENTVIDAFLLDDAIRGDNVDVQSIIDSCDSDAWELMKKIHENTYAQSLTPLVFQNFDFQSVHIRPSAWMFDKKIGVYISFTVYSQKLLLVDPAKWSI